MDKNDKNKTVQFPQGIEQFITEEDLQNRGHFTPTNDLITKSEQEERDNKVTYDTKYGIPKNTD